MCTVGPNQFCKLFMFFSLHFTHQKPDSNSYSYFFLAETTKPRYNYYLVLEVLTNLYLLPSRISYDPTRYPKYIPEAYCLCKGCLMGIFGEESLHFRSTPVFMPTVILRRTPACAGGRYVYTEDYITIPVGCTCVPEQEKEAESVNSSLDKQEVKLLVGQNKPSSEWRMY